jgi:hypothetical protein
VPPIRCYGPNPLDIGPYFGRPRESPRIELLNWVLKQNVEYVAEMIQLHPAVDGRFLRQMAISSLYPTQLTLSTDGSLAMAPAR